MPLCKEHPSTRVDNKTCESEAKEHVERLGKKIMMCSHHYEQLLERREKNKTHEKRTRCENTNQTPPAIPVTTPTPSHCNVLQQSDGCLQRLGTKDFHQERNALARCFDDAFDKKQIMECDTIEQLDTISTEPHWFKVSQGRITAFYASDPMFRLMTRVPVPDPLPSYADIGKLCALRILHIKVNNHPDPFNGNLTSTPV